MPKDVSNNRVYHEDGTSALPGEGFRAHIILAAGTAKTYVFPTTPAAAAAGRVVFFSSSAPFFVQESSTAVVPVADITNGDAPDQNPTVRFYNSAVTQLSLISSVACVVTMIITHK